MFSLLFISHQGNPDLWVPDQEVIGFIGETITIKCHYTIPGVRKWCKLGSTCVTGRTGSIDRTAITVNNTVDNVFSVTMSGLKSESSGWYYCGKGDSQMPVHLNVTVKPTGKRLQAVTKTRDAQVQELNICVSWFPASCLFMIIQQSG